MTVVRGLVTTSGKELCPSTELQRRLSPWLNEAGDKMHFPVFLHAYTLIRLTHGPVHGHICLAYLSTLCLQGEDESSSNYS